MKPFYFLLIAITFLTCGQKITHDFDIL